jgi:hypothetical protein
MRRTKLAVVVATMAACVAVVFAAPAGAAELGDPVGGCPTGGSWFLTPVAFALPDLDNGNFGDQNGDGWGCAFIVNPGQTAKHGVGSWTWKDNTNKLPS